MPANGSSYFTGTAYYSVANTTTNLVPSTSNFTVEAWVYLFDYTSINQVLTKADSSGGSSTGSWTFGTNNGTGRLQFGVSGTDYLSATGPVVPLNEWHHVALVRNSSTFTVWLDGTTSQSQTLSPDLSGTGELRIGRGRSTSTSYFSGYISNLRFVKGEALYTSSFTPSTTPLTKTANTQLLTCQYFTTDSSITDQSDNNFTITINNSVGTSFMSPFTSMNLANVGFNTDDLSKTTETQFIDFWLPEALKTLYMSPTDALVDRTITNPQDAYVITD